MTKVAAIQMCSSDNLEENLKQAEVLIKRASQNGAKLVVLPEMFPLIGAKPSDKVAIKEEYGHGKIQNFLATQAAKYKIWVVGGTIPIATPNSNKVRAACIVYDDKGRSVGRYDKIHLFDVVVSTQEKYAESETTEAGGDVVVVDTPLGKLGLAVCYDIRFPTMFTELFFRGAEILAIPAAFTVSTGQTHWHALTTARAIDNFCYVIGANQGGTHASGRKTTGHSLIIDPWGDIMQEHPGDDVGIVYSDIDLNYLHQIRSKITLSEHYRIMADITHLKASIEEKA